MVASYCIWLDEHLRQYAHMIRRIERGVGGVLRVSKPRVRAGSGRSPRVMKPFLDCRADREVDGGAGEGDIDHFCALLVDGDQRQAWLADREAHAAQGVLQWAGAGRNEAGGG